jgi:hypothetical protein
MNETFSRVAELRGSDGSRHGEAAAAITLLTPLLQRNRFTRQIVF